MKAHWILAVVYSVSSAAPAAPSLDCTKASGPTESAICSDPTLAALDQKLATVYAAALAELPEHDRAPLREGQRQWLVFIRIICSDRTIVECLTNHYIERVKQLDNAVTTVGGLRFRRIDAFKARKSLLQDEAPTFDTLVSAYPQIVTPMTPAQEHFNETLAAMARDEAADFEEGGADITFDYDDIEVSGALISVNTASSFYGHGAAHSMYSGAVIHWLRDEGRKLTAEDVFFKGTAWKVVLRDACFRAVKREGFVETPEDLNDLPEDPQRWLFSPEGLTIRFNPYEVASYADGMPEVTISWSTLKPYLRENAPIPPRWFP